MSAFIERAGRYGLRLHSSFVRCRRVLLVIAGKRRLLMVNVRTTTAGGQAACIFAKHRDNRVLFLHAILVLHLPQNPAEASMMIKACFFVLTILLVACGRGE